MTTEDRSIINKFKEEEIAEQTKKTIEASRKRLKYVAKVELLWCQNLATKEDFIQLHDWVMQEFNSDYEKYYRIYSAKGVEDFEDLPDKDRYEYMFLFRKLPIEEQIITSCAEWNEERNRRSESNRQLGWALAVVAGIGYILFKLFGFL